MIRVGYIENVFNATIVFYSNCSIEEAVEDVKKEYTSLDKDYINKLLLYKDCDGLCDRIPVTYPTGEKSTKFFLWVRDIEHISVFVHEVNHLTLFILEDRGIPTTYDNREILAYYQEHLFSFLLDKVIKIVEKGSKKKKGLKVNFYV